VLETQKHSNYEEEAPSLYHVYKGGFNSIDLIDKQWYKFDYSNKIPHWKTKYFLSMKKLAVLNPAMIQKTLDGMSYRKYRQAITIALITGTI